MPTTTLLASPIAWRPMAILMFCIGNCPAVFMIVVALLFHMTLSTIAQIGGDPAGHAAGAADEPVRRPNGG